MLKKARLSIVLFLCYFYFSQMILEKIISLQFFVNFYINRTLKKKVNEIHYLKFFSSFLALIQFFEVYIKSNF